MIPVLAPVVPHVSKEEAEAVVAFVQAAWAAMSEDAQAEVVERLTRIAEGTRRPLPDPRSES